MIRASHLIARVALAASLALAASGVASCAKKPVSLVDPSLAPPVYPEGQPGNTTLVTYPDTPVPVQLWQDNGEVGETPDDALLSTSYTYESGPGAVVGMIVDSTDASQYQVFKRQGDGGFVELFPYALQPTQSWTGNRYDAFLFSDPHPYAPPARQYIGRGVVGGLIGSRSPLTNLSDLTEANLPGQLTYLSPVDFGPRASKTDSLIPFAWRAVPGAAGYWLSMYAFPPAYLNASALLRNALPRPVVTDRLPAYLIAYIPAPNTSYTLYDPFPPGSHVVLSGRTLVMNVDYAVRIVAVDANGEVLDYTGSTGAYILLGASEGQYLRLPLDAVLVMPTGFVPPPPPSPAGAPARLAPRRLTPGEARVSAIAGPRR